MYTISKLADKKVEEDLKKIKDILIRELNPRSIILFGSFGKGEGSFRIRDGKVEILNDYDFYVVVDKNVGEKKIDGVSIKCANSIDVGGLEFIEHPFERYDAKRFFHVDVRCIRYDKIETLWKTQRTFELKNGGMVVYGENVLGKIPDVKIPVSDGIRLLWNKMHHLLLVEKNDEMIKRILTVKCFLDCCSALLIKDGNFVSSYRERNKVFLKSKYPNELKRLVDWATNYKIGVKVEDIDLDFLWDKARYWVGYSFKKIMDEIFSVRGDWKKIAGFIYYDLPYVYFNDYLGNKYLFSCQYYLTLRFLMRCWRRGIFILKPLFSWRDFGIRIATCMVLYLYDEKEESEKYLRKITMRVEPLRDRILELYGLYYGQRFV